MAELNVAKLRLYIGELDENTNQIQRHYTKMTKDFNEIRTVWNDKVFQEYLISFNEVNQDIRRFISCSKQIQDGLRNKMIPLTRYLKG
jgi:uncharacterized protein YukE